MFHLLFRHYAATSQSALVNKKMPHFHHERLFSTLYTMAFSPFPQCPSHIFKVRYRLIFQRDGCFKLILFTAPKCSKESKDLPGNSGVSWILLLEKNPAQKNTSWYMEKTSPNNIWSWNPAGFLVYQLVIPGYFGGFLHTFRDAPILMTLVIETWMVCCLCDVVVPSSWICENKHTRIFQWVLNGW